MATPEQKMREVLGMLMAAENQYTAITATLGQVIGRLPDGYVRNEILSIDTNLSLNKNTLHQLVNELTRAADGL